MAKAKLVDVLRHAYSGELGAARAYDGHARSVRDPNEARELFNIRDEEIDHRARVGAMLTELGAEPSIWRERLLSLVGLTIGLLCRVGGWFIPMYGAGRLERTNIGEYELAARLAYLEGREEWVDDILDMAEVEWDHESYFRKKVESHWLGRVIATWPAPPPRASIRGTYEQFVRDVSALRSQAHHPAPLATHRAV